MHAAVLRGLGAAPRCEQFADPVPPGDELIVEVRASSLKPVDKQLASGSHFASSNDLPVIYGTDGVGTLSDGTRGFFGGPRPPYGAMAERTVVRREFCFPLPENIDDRVAADDILIDALHKVLSHAASGELSIDTEHVRLRDIEEAWGRDPQGRRLKS